MGRVERGVFGVCGVCVCALGACGGVACAGPVVCVSMCVCTYCQREHIPDPNSISPPNVGFPIKNHRLRFVQREHIPGPNSMSPPNAGF